MEELKITTGCSEGQNVKKIETCLFIYQSFCEGLKLKYLGFFF